VCNVLSLAFATAAIAVAVVNAFVQLVALSRVVQANGDRGAYWRVLSDAGINRQRLESFDRPIVCEPEYFGDHKKEALIREFRNYLGILKAVHSGGQDVGRPGLQPLL
jgi:hypothetical protein